MKHKIVMDSAGDIQSFAGLPFACVPLKILAGDKEFVDDRDLNVRGMVEFLRGYKGKASTACPGVGEYLEAFEDAENVYVITITSGLSGSYNAACVAAQIYEADHPGRRVCVIDSLSAGPEMTLMVEKLAQLAQTDLSFEEIRDAVAAYSSKTGLLFMLESLKNFANNGRVPPAVAKIAGLLGIRIVGKASDEGTLEPLDKCRGEEKSLMAILQRLGKAGLHEGRVLIHHCMNSSAAERLASMIREKFPKVRLRIGVCRGLCSYYAEKGGLLVGFEKV